jgi:hypothetical protein
LSESIPEQLKPHAETLSQLFLMGCQDAVTDVASAALTGIADSIPILGRTPEIMTFGKVINPMLAVMNKSIQGGDDDIAIEGLAVIQEFCQLDQPVINDHLEVIVQFVLSILLHPENDSSLKKSAAQTLMDIIEFRPKLFAKKNLITPTLSMLMDRIAKDESSVAGSLFNFPHHDSVLGEDGKVIAGGENDDDEDDDPREVQKLSQTIIDTMAIHIPSKYFTDTVLVMISQGISSADPHMRKAGCAVLGVIAEGCQERLRESLSDIIPSLIRSLEDNELFVRECACFALGQFAEHCQPEVLNYHDVVLPSVFKALSDPSLTMQGTSCYVLEYFCEYLQPTTLKPYLAPLMNKLASLAQSPSRGIQEMALTALSATAIAAEHEFLPYADGTVEFLSRLLFLTEPTQLTTRGKALDCLGHIAIALGEENFRETFFEIGMRSTMQGIEMDNELLKEHGFVFIANIVKILGKRFKSFLPQLIPYIHQIIEESEIFKVVSDDEADGEEGGTTGAGDDEDDGNDEDDGEEGDYRLNVMEGFISTKKAAITALGALAEHTKEEFIPYLQKSLELIITKDIGVIASFHDDIRGEGISILDYFVESLCEAQKMKIPGKKEVLSLTPELIELITACFNACIFIISNDEEKLPVSNAFEAIHAILRRIGVVGLHLPVDVPNKENMKQPFANVILELLLLYLTEKSKCQTVNNLENQGGTHQQHDDDEDDDNDHDHVVIDSVADLIGGIAKLTGNDFVSYFDAFHPHLLKFTKLTRPSSDRIMAIGCYSEVFEEIGNHSLKYAEILLPLLQTGLIDKVEGVRRNSAYCLGTLVEKTERALAPHFLQFLSWLHPVCVRKEAEKSDYVGGADIDNAIAAVARMIHVAPEAIPLSQVLPVMLAALPLREDYDEGTVIFSTFYKLVQSNDATTLQFLPQLIVAFGANFSPESKVSDEQKVISVEALKLIAANPQNAPLFHSYLSSLTNNEHRQKLQEALQQS